MPILVSHEIPTFNTNMSVTMVLHFNVGLITKRASK